MKNNKIAACMILQALIFLYFWAMGLCITGKADIRQWSEIARVIYFSVSVVISTAANISYLKTDDNERK